VFVNLDLNALINHVQVVTALVLPFNLVTENKKDVGREPVLIVLKIVQNLKQIKEFAQLIYL